MDWIVTKLTCNWFAVGLHCWRKGHDWQTHRPTRCVSVTSCAWCGKYRGSSVSSNESPLPCRWYQPKTMKVERPTRYPDMD